MITQICTCKSKSLKFLRLKNRSLTFNLSNNDYICFSRPDNVAKAILEIIEKGQYGAVWVSQKDLPPIPIEEEKSNQFQI